MGSLEYGYGHGKIRSGTVVTCARQEKDAHRLLTSNTHDIPDTMLMNIGKTDDEKVYQTLKDMFEELGSETTANDAELTLETIFQGDDLEIGFQAIVVERSVLMSAILAITVPPEKQKDFVWQINGINADMLYGHFVLHPDGGMVTLDYTYIFDDAKPSRETLGYIVHSILAEVDKYDGTLSQFVWQ